MRSLRQSAGGSRGKAGKHVLLLEVDQAAEQGGHARRRQQREAEVGRQGFHCQIRHGTQSRGTIVVGAVGGGGGVVALWRCGAVALWRRRPELGSSG